MTVVMTRHNGFYHQCDSCNGIFDGLREEVSSVNIEGLPALDADHYVFDSVVLKEAIENASVRYKCENGCVTESPLTMWNINHIYECGECSEWFYNKDDAESHAEDHYDGNDDDIVWTEDTSSPRVLLPGGKQSPNEPEHEYEKTRNAVENGQSEQPAAQSTPVSTPSVRSDLMSSEAI